jgi:hypothetical protein
VRSDRKLPKKATLDTGQINPVGGAALPGAREDTRRVTEAMVVDPNNGSLCQADYL